MSRLRLAVLCALAAAVLAGCGAPSAQTVVPGGDPGRGKVVIVQTGCGSCHEIPGVADAHGLVGPPLGGLARRTTIAGVLPNTPDNMIRWLQGPQTIVPGNVMPNMEINDHDARDVAAYLYTLR